MTTTVGDGNDDTDDKVTVVMVMMLVMVVMIVPPNSPSAMTTCNGHTVLQGYFMLANTIFVILGQVHDHL